MAILNTSYEKTVSAQLFVGRGLFGGVKVITDGANDATLIVYDVAASGDAAVTNKLAEIKVSGGDFFGGIVFPHPIKCVAGLYCDVSGTDASYIAFYKKG